MEKLKVKKNKIMNESGKEIILKGITINSPGILKYEEKHDFLNDIKEIKKLGANAVRVPISPAYFQSKKNYCEEILDPIVSLCGDLELYCLLDWHAHGNPSQDITRKSSRFPDIEGQLVFDANKEHAKKALESLAKRYGKENHVLFETFCTPIDLSWEEWKSISQDFLSVIRKYSSSIVCINSVNWRQDSEGKKVVGEVDYAREDVQWYQNLKDILKNPLSEKNIVYGAKIYSEVPEEDKKSIIELKKEFPILIIECGYEKDARESYLRGTKESYGYPLKDFLESNKISFFAWAYHPTRQTTILNSWDPKDLTEWGKFLKEELLEF